MGPSPNAWFRGTFIAVSAAVFALGIQCSAFSAAESTPDGGDGLGVGGRFCDRGGDAAFCADFDRPGAAIDEGWTNAQTGGGGSVGLEPVDVYSAPGALRATAAPDAAPDASQPVRATLTSRPIPFKAGAQLRFMMRLPPVIAGYQGIARLDVGAVQFVLAVSKAWGASVTARSGAVAPVETSIAPRLDTDKWVAVAIDVEQPFPGSFSYSVSVDGITAVTPTAITADAADAAATTVSAQIGVLGADPPPSEWHVLYDNVQIYVR